MDGLEPLLANKVFSVVIEAEVSCLVPKPGERGNEERWKFGEHL